MDDIETLVDKNLSQLVIDLNLIKNENQEFGNKFSSWLKSPHVELSGDDLIATCKQDLTAWHWCLAEN